MGEDFDCDQDKRTLIEIQKLLLQENLSLSDIG